MSDSDEDYMSFKLPEDCKQDVRPSLLFNQEKRKHEQYKRKLESMNKRQKTLREIESETRDRGLTTAISSENKGFKLLEKMGFKPGDTLGKSQTGIREPIDIVLRQGTSGVGRDTHIKESAVRRQEHKVKKLRQFETKFRMANRERTILQQVRRDFFKAQKICEELDYRKDIKDPVEEYFWTKDTIKKRRKLKEEIVEDTTDSSDEDDDFEQFITEENLVKVIDYLRKIHLYCLYCVITGADMEDLKENCPGPYRQDHDDELD